MHESPILRCKCRGPTRTLTGTGTVLVKRALVTVSKTVVAHTVHTHEQSRGSEPTHAPAKSQEPTAQPPANMLGVPGTVPGTTVRL